MAEVAIEGGAETPAEEAIIDNLPPLEALPGVEREVMEYDVVIVGGGPAGMMVGLLFACAGVSVRVLDRDQPCNPGRGCRGQQFRRPARH